MKETILEIAEIINKNDNEMTLKEFLKLAKQLSPIDKVHLIQQLTPDLEREF